MKKKFLCFITLVWRACCSWHLHSKREFNFLGQLSFLKILHWQTWKWKEFFPGINSQLFLTLKKLNIFSTQAKNLALGVTLFSKQMLKKNVSNRKRPCKVCQIYEMLSYETDIHINSSTWAFSALQLEKIPAFHPLYWHFHFWILPLVLFQKITFQNRTVK